MNFTYWHYFVILALFCHIGILPRHIYKASLTELNMGTFWKAVKMKKFGELNFSKNKNNKDFQSPDEELEFILWAAELNKELMAFWKALTETD